VLGINALATHLFGSLMHALISVVVYDWPALLLRFDGGRDT